MYITCGHFPGLSSPGNGQSKIPALSRTRANPASSFRTTGAWLVRFALGKHWSRSFVQVYRPIFPQYGPHASSITYIYFWSETNFYKFRLHCTSWHGEQSNLWCPDKCFFSAGWQSFCTAVTVTHNGWWNQERRLVSSSRWLQPMASGGSW